MIASRRHALQLFIAAVAAGAVPGAAGGATLCQQLKDGLDINAASALGREYLQHHPLDPALKEILQTPLQRLREMVRDDYVAGRTVNLSGWFISRTEGCVLARIAMCAR